MKIARFDEFEVVQGSDSRWRIRYERSHEWMVDSVGELLVFDDVDGVIECLAATKETESNGRRSV